MSSMWGSMSQVTYKLKTMSGPGERKRTWVVLYLFAEGGYCKAGFRRMKSKPPQAGETIRKSSAYLKNVLVVSHFCGQRFRRPMIC